MAVEHVQQQTIANTQRLEATDPEAQRAFQARLTEAASDPVRASAWLLNTSMIGSLQRVEAIQ